MKKDINEELKEMLSFPVTLALLCFNINYSMRFETVPLEKLSAYLGIDRGWLEKGLRIFAHAGLASLAYAGDDILVEMKDAENDTVKNTVFDVIWSNKDAYSAVYVSLLKKEMVYSK